MVSKRYAPQFQVKTLENADSRSIGYLIGRNHNTIMCQIIDMGLEHSASFHRCTRLNSGKVFVSPCIIMTKENWLKYFEKTNKMMFIPENLK